LGFFPWSNIEQNRWIERFSNINVCGHWFNVADIINFDITSSFVFFAYNS
jgi:hypothetical protein